MNRRAFFQTIAGAIAVGASVKALPDMTRRDWWDVSDIRAAYRRNLGREATDAEIYSWLMPPSVRRERRINGDAN